MKKVKIKPIIVIISVLLVSLMALFAVHYAATLSVHGDYGTDAYAIKHSKVQSQSFIGDSFDDYPFYYQLSTDTEHENEIFIFSNADNKFFNFFGLGERYKCYLSASSDKAVSSVSLSIPTRQYKGDINHVIIYFSSNKDKIAKCVYQYKIEGVTSEETQDIQPNYGFTVLIPYITNQENTEIEITRVSFYDANENLVFEDIPTNLD